jgi:hypothetical protein
MPIPIRSGASRSPPRALLISSSLTNIMRAALNACMQARPLAICSPNNAITASPMNLSTWPPAPPYRGLPEVDYPFHDRTVTVTTCGLICFNRQKINLSTVFAGQSVGIKQVSEQIWLVSFMDYDLGYFDHETCRLEPIENPFGPEVLGPPS